MCQVSNVFSLGEMAMLSREATLSKLFLPTFLDRFYSKGKDLLLWEQILSFKGRPFSEVIWFAG